jgi:hypothetical protein
VGLALGLIVIVGAVAGLLITARKEQATPEGAVSSYLRALSRSDCGAAIAKLSDAAQTQIHRVYSNVHELCRRLEESRRIPRSFTVVSVTGEGGEQGFEVAVEVSYPDATVLETYVVLQEQGELKVQPPWA